MTILRLERTKIASISTLKFKTSNLSNNLRFYYTLLFMYSISLHLFEMKKRQRKKEKRTHETTLIVDLYNAQTLV